MKVLFAIRGIANIGKSTTVKNVLAVLLARFPRGEWSVYKHRRGRKDILGVFTIDGVKIGIEAQGDVAEKLGNSLEQLMEDGCEIIVCTDRSRRLDEQPVEDMEAYGFEIRIRPKNRQDGRDQTLAGEIVDEIEELLLGAATG